MLRLSSFTADNHLEAWRPVIHLSKPPCPGWQRAPCCHLSVLTHVGSQNCLLYSVTLSWQLTLGIHRPFKNSCSPFIMPITMAPEHCVHKIDNNIIPVFERIRTWLKPDLTDWGRMTSHLHSKWSLGGLYLWDLMNASYLLPFAMEGTNKGQNLKESKC